jgi:hypothetical protein
LRTEEALSCSKRASRTGPARLRAPLFGGQNQGEKSISPLKSVAHRRKNSLDQPLTNPNLRCGAVGLFAGCREPNGG